MLEIGSERYFTEPLHEAISAVQDDHLDHWEIAEVARKGYSYRSKVLRKAQVVVNTRRKERAEREE